MLGVDYTRGFDIKPTKKYHINDIFNDIRMNINIKKHDIKFNIDTNTFVLLCENNKLDEIKKMISEDINKTIDIHIRFEYPFRIACYYGFFDIVKYLLSLEKKYGKININIPYIKYLINEEYFPIKTCPLYGASISGNLELVKYLLNIEDYKYYDINKAIDFALENNNIYIFKYLITTEKNVDYKKYLTNCCKNNNLNLFKYLLQFSTNIDNIFHLLIYACNNNNIEFVKYIIFHFNYKFTNINIYEMMLVSYKNLSLMKFLYSYLINNDNNNHIICFDKIKTDDLNIIKYIFSISGFCEKCIDKLKDLYNKTLNTNTIKFIKQFIFPKISQKELMKYKIELFL